MLQFVVTTVFMVSLGALLFLLARSLPRVDEEPILKEGTLFDRWVSSGVPEKVDALLNSFLEKLLRKIRVTLLRADNAITSWLRKVKPEALSNGKPSIDFKEIAGEKGVASEPEKVNNNQGT